ncbi:PaaI family thioesterase [Aspergillus lucknowensis]|uniref:Thioesterase domain-containing protein n=1 Tax=Aspergillus lucknowensis TaxID=176173 RepID=A0ABR4L906_9EURO
MDQDTSTPPIEVSLPLQQVLNVWDCIRGNSPIYEFLLGDGLALHGVFSACATDWAGGLAIASCGLESTSVSPNINVNYLFSATPGDWLEIKGYANKFGKTLAFTTIANSKCTISGDITLLAQGSHTKYIKTR